MFLAICALFFCVPLYVIVVTSLKTMDQIRQGDIFALPTALDFDAWVTAWDKSCSGINCAGIKVGFVNSLEILFPSLVAVDRAVLGHRLRAGAVERALGQHLPVHAVHLRLRAVPDHHGAADPDHRLPACLRHRSGASRWCTPCSPCRS